MTAHPGASWFETRGVATLLAMRVEDLILRSALARASKDEAAVLENGLWLRPQIQGWSKRHLKTRWGGRPRY